MIFAPILVFYNNSLKDLSNYIILTHFAEKINTSAKSVWIFF